MVFLNISYHVYVSIIENAFKMLYVPNNYNFHIFNIYTLYQVHVIYITNMELVFHPNLMVNFLDYILGHFNLHFIIIHLYYYISLFIHILLFVFYVLSSLYHILYLLIIILILLFYIINKLTKFFYYDVFP